MFEPLNLVIFYSSIASRRSTRLGRCEPRTAKGRCEKAGLQDELRRAEKEGESVPSRPLPMAGRCRTMTVLSHMLACTQISGHLQFATWNVLGSPGMKSLCPRGSHWAQPHRERDHSFKPNIYTCTTFFKDKNMVEAPGLLQTHPSLVFLQ